MTLCLCSLLAATREFSIPIGQKMQLTGWDNSNEMRNATCVDSKTSIEWPYCLFPILCPRYVPGLGGGFILTGALVAESQGCRNHTGRGATFVKNGQMLLKHLSWIGKIVKIYEMFLKKLHFW